MPYTNQQLQSRHNILQTQSQLCNFLDADIVNTLVHLFESNTIAKYIEDERIFQGMNTSNITITSNVNIKGYYGPSLYLNILKNNQKYIHLSIHLCIKDLEPTKQGTVHMVKNVFDDITRYTNISKSNFKRLKPRMYALITVHQPTNKPNSLEFTIEDEYLTTDISGANTNDSQLQREMKAILDVLNRLFNEKNENYYIGRKKDMTNVHKKTNIILANMNMHTKHATRKNRGVMLGPVMSTNTLPVQLNTYTISNHANQNRGNKNRRSKTRRVRIRYTNLRNRLPNLPSINADIGYQEPESLE
jgi:hypothetical protein